MAVLRVFHQGQSNDGWLWMNEFNGTKWAGDANVRNTGMSAGPSPVALNDKLYVFHKGQSVGMEAMPLNLGWLYVNVFDGFNWVGDAQVPNTGITGSPSALTFNGKLYVFHRGQSVGMPGHPLNEGWLWMNVFDGAKWAGDTQVPNTGMSGSPSAVTFNGKLYVFHRGQSVGFESASLTEGGHSLWMNVFDGTNWAGDMSAPDTGLSDGPGAIVW